MKKKGRKILLTNEQIKRLDEMDIQLSSDGTVAGTQNVLNKSQQQFNQAKSMDGKNPNATITTPNTDNSKPTAYIQSNPGESPAQAISDNSETVQKAFNNNGSVSVEVNESKYAPITKKELLEIRKRRGQILTKESVMRQIMNENTNYKYLKGTYSIDIFDDAFINDLSRLIGQNNVQRYIINNEDFPSNVDITVNATEETDKGDYYMPDAYNTMISSIEYDDYFKQHLSQLPPKIARILERLIKQLIEDNLDSIDWEERDDPYANNDDEPSYYNLSEANIRRIVSETINRIVGR